MSYLTVAHFLSYYCKGLQSHLLAIVKCLFWKGVIISPCAELCDTCQF